MEFIYICFLSYLVGSLPVAIIISKLLKLQNPTTSGSKNPGATNMMRVNGKLPALLTLFLDVFKGMIIIVTGKLFSFDTSQLLILMLICIAGHVYPIFNRFIGGKGVATLFGCLSFISLPTSLFAVGIWFLIAKVSKISSLAAILTMILTPVFSFFFIFDFQDSLLLLMSCLLIVYRHKSNIYKLLKHEEKPI